MTSKIPEHLQTRLAQGRVIPFVGAGVSRTVRHRSTNEPLFPSWHELLLRAAVTLTAAGKSKTANTVKALLDDELPDYRDIASRAAGSLGDRWYAFLKTNLDPAYDDAAPESLALARAIWALDSRLIITTNYDRVLQWACPPPAQPELRVWHIQAPLDQSDLLSNGPRLPTVWHLHGTIQQPDSIILTTQSYEALYGAGERGAIANGTKYAAALATLKVLLTSYTFVFIGFSFDDSQFRDLLHELGAMFHGGNQHYVLVRESDDHISAPHLPIQSITFQKFGAPLLAIVEDLGRLAAADREREKRLAETTERLSPAELDALLALIGELTKDGRDSQHTLEQLIAIVQSRDDEGLLRTASVIADDLQNELLHTRTETETKASELRDRLDRINDEIALVDANAKKLVDLVDHTRTSIVKSVRASFELLMSGLPGDLERFMQDQVLSASGFWMHLRLRSLSEVAAERCTSFAQRRIDEWQRTGVAIMREGVEKLLHDLAGNLSEIQSREAVRMTSTDYHLSGRFVLDPRELYDALASEAEVQMRLIVTQAFADMSFTGFLYMILQALVGFRFTVNIERKVKAAAVEVFTRQIRQAGEAGVARLTAEIPSALDHDLRRIVEQYKTQLASIHEELSRMGHSVVVSQRTTDDDVARLVDAGKRVEELGRALSGALKK
jgi:SIR2-like domain